MEMSHPQARGYNRRAAKSRRFVKKTASKKMRLAERHAIKKGDYASCPSHSREAYDAAWELY
jgi:hypothetical protein